VTLKGKVTAPPIVEDELPSRVIRNSYGEGVTAPMPPLLRTCEGC
jgi:hypothetical protein